MSSLLLLLDPPFLFHKVGKQNRASIIGFWPAITPKFCSCCKIELRAFGPAEKYSYFWLPSVKSWRKSWRDLSHKFAGSRNTLSKEDYHTRYPHIVKFMLFIYRRTFLSNFLHTKIACKSWLLMINHILINEDLNMFVKRRLCGCYVCSRPSWYRSIAILSQWCELHYESLPR